MDPIVIYHTADLHGQLPEDAISRLAQLKRATPGALLLDAGDALPIGNLGIPRRPEPFIQRMVEAEYDAMVMGNRESHPFRWALQKKVSPMPFPVLAANLRSREASLPEPLQASIIFKTPFANVAVFGLSPRMTSPRSRWSRLADYYYDDPLETARHILPDLHAQADLTICLAHCSEDAICALAELPMIDLVLAGHIHKKIIQRPACGALIVCPGAYGNYVARSTLTSREDARAELIPLKEEAS